MQIHLANIPDSKLLVGEGFVESLSTVIDHAELRQALLHMIRHQIGLSSLPSVLHRLNWLVGGQFYFLYKPKQCYTLQINY